jgi:2-amino-4-hydroxy-6-hydroxymethyldihydropteridine diphosphokinase
VLGRVRTQRWGLRARSIPTAAVRPPRHQEADPGVPHLELTRRSFVLVPLVEIEPLLVHPETGDTLIHHLSQLNTRPPVKRGSRLWN